MLASVGCHFLSRNVRMVRDGEQKLRASGRRKAATVGRRISGQQGEPISLRFEITSLKRTQSAWSWEFLMWWHRELGSPEAGDCAPKIGWEERGAAGRIQVVQGWDHGLE